MRNLNQASVTLNKLLADSQSNLRSTLQNANKITTDLAKVSGELSEAELNKVIADAQTTLNNLNTLLADIEGGKGTIGKLMKDEALYKDLDKSAKQLELLLQDFRLNPKRYVHFSIFGKKAKVYEPQDEEKSE
jgi:secreted MCE family protein